MRSMVEGAASLLHDTLGNRGRVVQNLTRGDSQDGEAARTQLSIAHRIMLHLCFGIVHESVNLDDEPGLAAEEIDYIRFDRVLTPEFQPARMVPQVLPKHDLGQCHFASKAAGGVDGRAVQLR